jgi:hypothetical protein
MTTRLAAVPFLNRGEPSPRTPTANRGEPSPRTPTADRRRPAGPMHRSIVAIDLEGSTTRTNLVKGELRRTMYDLLGRALEASAISENHLEQLTDRGDGVLILIRPHDDVPKTILLDRLIPQLTALLAEHNAAISGPPLQIRLRTVVHAGEIHDDGRGFYGDAIDVAIRLLDAVPVKKALKEATTAALVLVVSDEIYSAIVCQDYVDGGSYRPLVRVRVGRRLHRGWVHIPYPDQDARSGAIYRDRIAVISAGTTSWRSPMTA